jgi:hypothetical protein
MISPNTPPGTIVCCINNAPGDYGPVALTLGGYYTIDHIAEAKSNIPVAILTEVKPATVYDSRYGQMLLGFGLSRFRYLYLPDAFDLLAREQEVELVECE